MNTRKLYKPLLKAGLYSGAALVGSFALYKGYSIYSNRRYEQSLRESPLFEKFVNSNVSVDQIPTREEQLNRLDKSEYDILIIGK